MNNVFIIADSSGKMSELGKDHLQTYVLHAAVDMLADLGVQPQLLVWAGNLEELEEPDVPAFGGRVDTDALTSAFAEMGRGSCIMLLSDGNFEYGDIPEAAEEYGIKIVGVYLGADADVLTMDKISTSHNAMPAEDIAAAVSQLFGYIRQEEQ